MGSTEPMQTMSMQRYPNDKYLDPFPSVKSMDAKAPIFTGTHQLQWVENEEASDLFCKSKGKYVMTSSWRRIFEERGQTWHPIKW